MENCCIHTVSLAIRHIICDLHMYNMSDKEKNLGHSRSSQTFFVYERKISDIFIDLNSCYCF